MDHYSFTHPDNHPHRLLWQYHLFQGYQVHHTTSLIWDPLIINTESKAISKTGKRKCWKQGFEKQTQTVITATTSTILEFPDCIAAAITATSDTRYCNFPQYQISCQNHFTTTI